MLSRATVGVLLSLLVLLAACGGSEAAEPVELSESDTILTGDDFFDPEHAVVEAGATVTWEWDGNRPHNVVGEGFESDVLTGDGSFQHTFDEPGMYEYTCTLHHGMDGVIEVR